MRVKIIEEKLREHFNPEHLEVIDDGEKHRGHAGSAAGAGHYTVVIKSSHFNEKSKVLCHREIYQVLNEMIGPEIHALSIKIL